MVVAANFHPTGQALHPAAAHWKPGQPTVGPLASFYLSWKTGLDFLLALVLLVVAAPLVLVSAVLVKLTSRGPAFYSQTRVGRNGRPFAIYKIRTMVDKCESQTGARWATPGDARVTGVGRFLRLSHLDELPQLWNVLRGDMSLVGPRPERPEFVPQLERVIVHYADRLLVRPGLTGLAQVQLPPDTDLASVRRKLAYDLYYVQRVSAWLDVRILLGTVCHVLHLPVAVSRILFGVPGGAGVERAYQNLVALAAGLPAGRGPKDVILPGEVSAGGQHPVSSQGCPEPHSSKTAEGHKWPATAAKDGQRTTREDADRAANKQRHNW